MPPLPLGRVVHRTPLPGLRMLKPAAIRVTCPSPARGRRAACLEAPAQAGHALEPARWGGTGTHRFTWTNGSRGPGWGWRTTRSNVSQKGGGETGCGAPPCRQVL